MAEAQIQLRAKLWDRADDAEAFTSEPVIGEIVESLLIFNLYCLQSAGCDGDRLQRAKARLLAERIVACKLDLCRQREGGHTIGQSETQDSARRARRFG